MRSARRWRFEPPRPDPSAGCGSTRATAPNAAARASATAETSTATTRAPSDRGDHHRGQPQPATAEHGHPLAGGDAAVDGHRTEGGGEPAAQRRGGLEAHLRGERDEVEVGALHGDLLGKGAGPGEPGLALVGADLCFAARQCSHAPQPSTKGTVTRSPTDHRRTCSPTAATTPANSCPGMCGSATASWPRQACQSERHTPVARTSTTTPSAGHRGGGTSTTSGRPYASNRTALTAPQPRTTRRHSPRAGSDPPTTTVTRPPYDRALDGLEKEMACHSSWITTTT